MTAGSKQVVIEIDEKGEIKVETFGFQGKGCLEESQWIKDALGYETERIHKPEFYTKEKVKVSNKLTTRG